VKIFGLLILARSRVRAGEGGATPDVVGRTRLEAGGTADAVVVKGADGHARTGDVAGTRVGVGPGAVTSSSMGALVW
jgi:hypothetical protein